MCVQPLLDDLTNLSVLIRDTIIFPKNTFMSHVSAKIPEDLIGYYSDEHIQLTRRNQQTVDSSRLPALHEVDLGESRALSEDESHHLYNLFMLTGGVTGIVASDSVGSFSDTAHNIYHFTPDGLSFNIVERETTSSIEDYIDKVNGVTQDDFLPALPTLVLNGWGLYQLSSKETSNKFNVFSEGYYDGDAGLFDIEYFISDHWHVLVLQSYQGNIELKTASIVNHAAGGYFTLFPDDNSFPGRISLHGDCILITKGPRWAVLNAEFEIIRSGQLDHPAWDAVPFNFSGLSGWVVATGGSTTNLTSGVLEGGELIFLSIQGAITIRGYAGSAPTALYKDGGSLYVGVALGGSDLEWQHFNSNLRKTTSNAFATSFSEASIGTFFTHAGALYAIAVEAGGATSFSPVILDLENNTQIAFTNRTFTAPTNWTPHTRLHLAEVPILDMRTGGGAAQLVPNEYHSVAAIAPSNADYVSSARYSVLTYDLDFDLLPLRVDGASAPSLAGAGVVNGAFVVQSNTASFRLKLISNDNQVLPNIKLIRFQTLKELPSPFSFRRSNDSNTYVHKNGVRYTFGGMGNGYRGFIVDVVERNGTLYGIRQLSRIALSNLLGAALNLAGSWIYTLAAPTATTTTTLENVIELPTNLEMTVLYDEIPIGGINYYFSKPSQTFNAEPVKCDELFESDRSWTNKRYFTKRLSTFDCGIVLRPPSGIQHTEIYYPQAELSAIEWHVDLTADNATITAPRYDSSSTGEFLFRAAGTPDFADFFEPITNSQVDILCFGSQFLTGQFSGVADYEEGLSRVFTGQVESVESEEANVNIKLVGSIETIGTQIRDTTSVSCPYVFGGVQCGVALTKTRGVVTASGTKAITVQFESTLPLPVDRYVQGTVKLGSLGFQNVEIDVVRVSSVSGTSYRIVFYAALSKSIPVGTTVTLANGCTKTMERCNDYGNILRGRMLPYLQGGKVFVASGQIRSN